MYGLVSAHKKKRKKIGWANPTLLWATLSPVSWVGLAYIYLIYILFIIIYIIIFKKIQKKFKNHFKKIVIFSNIFLSILHNIGLYIYTVKYKFDIKIPGFLQNISKKLKKFSKKKISKSFKLIFPLRFFLR